MTHSDLTEEIQRLKLNLEALKLSLSTDQTLTEIALTHACSELEKRGMLSSAEWKHQLRGQALLTLLEKAGEEIPHFDEWHESYEKKRSD
jgi:hypothetical protein